MSSDLNKLTDIEKMAKIWQLELNMEYLKPKKNVRLSFKDIGPFCEYLATSFLPGYTGGGSGGMGFDLINKQEGKAFEIKSCCTIQNAKCKDCGAKFNDLFHSVCPDCKSSKYSPVGDSRFGIDAKETLDQIDEDIFGGFMLCHVSKANHDTDKTTLYVKASWYKVQFDTELKDVQLAYFKTQLKDGSKAHCNLLPNAFDFYKLCPLKINETMIEINYGDLNTTPKISSKDCSEYPRVPMDILYNSEIPAFTALKTFNPKDNTADCREFTTAIPYRKKSLGRPRGSENLKINKHNQLKKQS